MDCIALARQLGHALQEDERYIRMAAARQQSDEDGNLQELIGEFNLKRLAINNEAGSGSPDSEKMKTLNAELRAVYAKIMQNGHMQAYDAAKQEFDQLMQRVTAILTQSADGEDPETADYTASCGGDCSGCAGCH